MRYIKYILIELQLCYSEGQISSRLLEKTKEIEETEEIEEAEKIKENREEAIGSLLSRILPESMTKSRIDYILDLYPRAIELMRQHSDGFEDTCVWLYYELLHHGEITDNVKENILSRDDAKFLIDLLYSVKYENKDVINTISNLPMVPMDE